MFFSWLAVVVAVLVPGGQGASQTKPITVSAAVSLTEALTAASDEYRRATHAGVRLNFAASNVLARQIVNGAPVDLFVSADGAQMDVVAAAGFVKAGSRIDLLTNQLVVVVPSDRPRTFKAIREIADPSFKRIAIGDPAGVPAGVYAKQYLERVGLWATLEPRIVPSGSVRAALAAVESGAADAAIVYRTDARTAPHTFVAWLVSLATGPRIVYPAAIVKASSAADGAQRFLDFLRSPAGIRIFEEYGFSIAGPAR